jgi:hypothetical protein
MSAHDGRLGEMETEALPAVAVIGKIPPFVIDGPCQAGLPFGNGAAWCSQFNLIKQNEKLFYFYSLANGG